MALAWVSWGMCKVRRQCWDPELYDWGEIYDLIDLVGMNAEGRTFPLTVMPMEEVTFEAVMELSDPA